MLLISLIHEHHIYIHICEEAKYVNLPVSLKNPCAKCFTPPIPPVLPHIPALPTVVPAQVAVSPSIRVCCPNWVRHPTMAICTFVHFHKGNSSHSGYTSYRVMIHACIHTYIHTWLHPKLPDCPTVLGTSGIGVIHFCFTSSVNAVIQRSSTSPSSNKTHIFPSLGSPSVYHWMTCPERHQLLKWVTLFPKWSFMARRQFCLKSKTACTHTYIHTYMIHNHTYIRHAYKHT